MLWPVPIGVRVRPAFKTLFLAQLGDCRGDSATISNFPEYEHQLNAAQKLQLRGIAEQIVFSQKNGMPIAAVAVVGHADRAQRLKGAEATAKERDVSQKRADVAKTELIAVLKGIPDGAGVAAKIEANTEPIGKGATKLIVQWPQDEAEMQKNRRVEFFWARCHPNPVIHPSVEFPPRPAPSEEDDPNTVFAGQRFKSKLVDGFSVSLGVGFISLTMVIWDTDNHRLAGYDYSGGVRAVGVNPIPHINETGWSDFTTPVAIQVDQFGGTARHENKIAGLGVFTLASVMPDIAPRQWPVVGQQIGQWTSLGAAVALEESKGSLSLIRGSVRVFKGP